MQSNIQYQPSTKRSFTILVYESMGPFIQFIDSAVPCSMCINDPQFNIQHNLVHDCEVSEWSDWDTCVSDTGICGQGKQQRKRKVTRPESNGGVSCPDLHQTRVCHVKCPELAATAQHVHDADWIKPNKLFGSKHKESSALRGNHYLQLGITGCWSRKGV